MTLRLTLLATLFFGLVSHSAFAQTEAEKKEVTPWQSVVNAARLFAADSAKHKPIVNDDLEMQRATVARNAEALAELRNALKKGIVQPPEASAMPMADINAVRALPRLLAQESQVYAADKNWSDAAQSALDIIDFSTQFPRGGVMMSALMGWAMEYQGTKELSALELQLPTAVARSAAARLAQIDKARLSLADVIRNERAYSMREFEKLFKGPEWASRSKFRFDDIPEAERKDLSRADTEAYFTMTEEEIVKEFEAQTELIIKLVNKPQPRDWRNKIELPAARFMLTRGVDALWTDTHTVFNGSRALVNARLLQVQLAARAFNAEKNRWPTSLNELVPEYLDEIPVDPFSGSSLRAKIGADSFVPYSIGPDGKDDEGKPLRSSQTPAFINASPPGMPPRAQAPAPSRTQTDSVGDIVYGFNS